jgi:hypothetical protein
MKPHKIPHDPQGDLFKTELHRIIDLSPENRNFLLSVTLFDRPAARCTFQPAFTNTHMTTPSEHPRDPLHGMTLEKILIQLVDDPGWEEMG